MRAVPSRAEWSTEYAANNAAATVQSFDAFGWKVHRHVLPVGAQLVTRSRAEVPRELAPNRAMYVRGRATCVNDGRELEDRVPGLCTQERPNHPAGVTVVTAVEETELWCFNWTVNRRALPILTPIRLAVGKRAKVAAGSLVFVMAGQCGDVVGPACFVPDKGASLKADTDFYAFVISEAKA